MAWTTPPTFSSGATLAAADVNILGDDLTYLKGITDGVSFSAVKATRAAATSIPNAAYTAVTFTAETYDYGGWYASGTNIVVPAGAIPSGYTTIAVMATGRAVFAANATGVRRLQVSLNGTAQFQPLASGDGTDATDLSGFGFLIVAAADIITLEVYQTSGAALNASGMSLNVVRFAPVA